MIRIILFLLSNISIMTIFGLILELTKIQSNSKIGILIISSLLSFGGAFISLLTSKSIALKKVNGIIVEYPKNNIEKWITKIIKNQAKIMKIKTPQIAIYETSDINAFATGSCKNNALIAISTGLLQKMDKDKISAVIAHEISHIANGDMITMTLLQGTINTFVIFIAKIFTKLIIKLIYNKINIKNKSSLYFIISKTLEIIFATSANIITLWFSRYREFRADAGSAKIVGKEKMISTLKQLIKNQIKEHERNILTTFYIHTNYKTLHKIFMSHPTLQKRIKELNNETYF